MQAIIQKEDIHEIVEGLSLDKEVIAPVLLPDGEALYSPIKRSDRVSLDSSHIPIMSAKEFFFGSEEELFQFERTSSQDIKITPAAEPKDRVFLGIRSCDLKGVRFLQNFFEKPYNDETVTRKIEKTVFISLGCVAPAEHCFCVCCDGGPFLVEGADAQLVDLEDRFFCETFTSRGEEIFSHHQNLLKPAQAEDWKKKSATIEKVDQRFTQRSYMAVGVKETSMNTVPEKVWEVLENRCMSCGSCTYVCPTCSCFNVFDRSTPEGGIRIRTWDSCSYSGFTREVSGHNPREHTRDRLKRRFFHKLSYQCLRSNGRIGCVGCGRCVVSCPAFVDMSTFVTLLRQAKSEKTNG
ncbi:MAG: 4Fe-4S dicluster domain-containing protein [Proteobacteria bacterium]|nr:4Fe-4S dicluster domain-containing protein [Pseudomonadota bacterium]